MPRARRNQSGSNKRRQQGQVRPLPELSDEEFIEILTQASAQPERPPLSAEEEVHLQNFLKELGREGL